MDKLLPSHRYVEHVSQAEPHRWANAVTLNIEEAHDGCEKPKGNCEDTHKYEKENSIQRIPHVFDDTIAYAHYPIKDVAAHDGWSVFGIFFHYLRALCSKVWHSRRNETHEKDIHRHDEEKHRNGRADGLPNCGSVFCIECIPDVDAQSDI